MSEQDEFYIAVIVWGGIIFAGSMIAIGLVIVGLSIFRKKKKTTELYDQSERKNGQQKGGSHGKW